ncbi:MAG: lysylphosphatidylglycerol synthase transmembrane domain-containing protein [Flavobacteriaceae bacterium]|nr:lysylphosphatidylglycerol synthase transmembrane domain-containing protein [Flavobacteriaceae bacterium]MDG2499780.1 lysylphosphatidylglycerol synthase transmembrane domain-containing protein [Flavobacteriaceae bacterium]
MKKQLKILIPIALGLFFIYLTFQITSEAERALIWSYIKSAKIEYVLAAMCLGACADIIRGLRWQFLSKAIGHKSNSIISIASVFMCYTSNMAIPRSGEVIRATILSEYNKIPISKTLGTIAAERVVDVSISILILVFVWLLQYNILLESFFADDFLYSVNNNSVAIVSLFIFIAIVLVIIISQIEKIKIFFKGILEGFLSLTKLKKKLFPFILFSSLIWTCYILAFFVIKFSVSELSIINNSLVFPTFVVGVFSISLSNHGLGVYPLAISLFLVNFGINTEIGLTYGWLAWSCQAIITLIFGGLSFFVLPLLNTSD